MVQLLLQAGANETIKNKNGKTALDVASPCDKCDKVFKSNKQAALKVAAEEEHDKCVQWLLQHEHGFDVNYNNYNESWKEGWTVLHYAASKGQKGMG